VPYYGLGLSGGSVDPDMWQHLPSGVHAQCQAASGVLVPDDLDAPRGTRVLKQPAAAEQRAQHNVADLAIVGHQVSGSGPGRSGGYGQRPSSWR
jgi:hypothetical protein